MRLTRTDLAPVLTIIVSGAFGVLASGTFLLFSPADDVREVVVPSATAESTLRYVARGESSFESTETTERSPQRVVAVVGDRQVSEVGTLLPVRLMVMVTDEAGNPIPGAEVRFLVQSGGGLTAPSRARTNSHGPGQRALAFGHGSGSPGTLGRDTGARVLGDVHGDRDRAGLNQARRRLLESLDAAPKRPEACRPTGRTI